MRTTKYAVLGLSILLLFSASTILFDDITADAVTIDLLDENEQVLPDNKPLIKKELILTTYTGEDPLNPDAIRYVLEKESTLTQSTFYLRINANTGTYKVSISVPETAITGSLYDAGMLVKLTHQDNEFVAGLDSNNGFVSNAMDESDEEPVVATLLPNVLYKLEIVTEKEIKSNQQINETPDFTLRFEATPTSGHLIEFYDDLTLIETRIVDTGDPIGELPSPPPREGWNFDGWFDVDGNNITSSTIVTKDLRLHTRWSTTPVTEYTVAFYDDNRLVDIRTVEYGEPIGDLPSVPPREGYDFDGWCDEYGDFVSSSTTVTDDMTLHTEWTKKPEVGHTVDFYDGSELVLTRTVMDGEPIGDLPTPRPRTGWLFDGWFDESGSEVSSSTIVTSDMSLYTKWSVDPGPEPPQPEGKTIITEETIINDDGSISHITTETTERLDGSDDRQMTVVTDHVDGSNVEMIIETSHDADGNEAICDCTVTIIENEDGTVTVQQEHEEKDYDGFQKITEYIKIESTDSDIIEIDQIVTYIEPDGTRHVYSATGDEDSIEIIMPNTQQIDVEFAKDSIEGLNYRNVIVGVYSESGILVIPEETMPLVVEYDYMVSVNNGIIHAILDNDVVDNIYSLGGEMKLMIHQATGDDLSKAQTDVIGNNYAVSVSLLVDDKYVSELGGEAEISVQTDRDDVTVYYVDTEGNLELIDSTYEGGDTVIFINHFSIYMYETEGGDTPGVNPIAIMFTSVIIMFLPLEILRWREKKE